jgi:hypothetical protein
MSHTPGRLPDEDRTMLADMPLVSVKQRPRLAYGGDAHSNMAPGIVAMPGRTAAITS